MSRDHRDLHVLTHSFPTRRSSDLVFTDDVSSVGGGNNSYSLDARAVFSPKMGENQLHFGGSIHHRELNDIAGDIRYRQRPQVHSTSVRFVATPNLPTDAETSYGVEIGRAHV